MVGMLLVAARCRVRPDHCQDFVHQVDRIIPVVRAEPGCTRYELHADVFEEGLFIFCEEWESQKQLDDHIATPHMQDHFVKCAAWMAAPTELTIYEVSGLQTVVLS
jgi:quinol monooxygenase YgiN